MKVTHRECEIVCKGAILIKDTQNRTIGTVVLKPTLTVGTNTTTEIDLTNNPSPNQPLIRRLFHNPCKLVPRDAAESHVPFQDLNIRVAYPGTSDPDQGLISRGHGYRIIIMVGEPVFKY